MVHSILLLGQSNMSGRGVASEVPVIENERMKNLRNGRWYSYFVPVHWDRGSCGTCLAESFADAYSKDHPDVDVGMIPCADGGSSLNMWAKGEPLYDLAIFTAKLAQRTSDIVAILWHQGESDCRSTHYPLYEEKLTKIIENVRKDLNLPDVPFIMGGLGDYLKDCPRNFEPENYVHINMTLQKMAAEQEHLGFVSAEGLTSNPDMLHFNAASLREFGLRYYEVFRKMEDTTKTYAEKKDTSERTGLEEL